MRKIWAQGMFQCYKIEEKEMTQKSRPRRNESEVEEETLEPSKEKTSRTPQPVFNLRNCYSPTIPTYSFTTMRGLLSFCFYCFLSIYCFFSFFLLLCSLPTHSSCPRVKTTVKKGKKLEHTKTKGYILQIWASTQNRYWFKWNHLDVSLTVI